MTEFYVLFVAIVVAMSQVCRTSPWDKNLHLILTQNITQILCKTDGFVPKCQIQEKAKAYP